MCLAPLDHKKEVSSRVHGECEGCVRKDSEPQQERALRWLSNICVLWGMATGQKSRSLAIPGLWGHPRPLCPGARPLWNTNAPTLACSSLRRWPRQGLRLLSLWLLVRLFHPPRGSQRTGVAGGSTLPCGEEHFRTFAVESFWCKVVTKSRRTFSRL